MTVLLTGATGLVGTFILEQLLSKGFKVKALVRNIPAADAFQFSTEGVQWVQGNILDVVSLNDAMDGVNSVIHSAAVVSYASSREEEMYKTNVEGTANVVNSCLVKGVQRLCYISSVAALGTPKKEEKFTEKLSFDESKSHSAYSFSKFYAELEVWRAMEEGLNGIILNPSIILGPGNWNAGSTKLFKYVWDENKYYISGGYNFVDVRDVAELSVKALLSDQRDQRYLLTGFQSTYSDLFTSIGKNFGKRAPFKRAALWQKKLLRLWSNIKTFFTGGEPLITRNAIQKSEEFPEFNNSKILEALPHEYRNKEECLEWSCQRLKARYSE